MGSHPWSVHSIGLLVKILTLDIETTPNIIYDFQLWGNRNTGVSQIIKPSELLCVAYKWHGQEDVFFSYGPNYEFAALWQDKPYYTLRHLYEAVNEADAIVTYNGKKFDIPKLNSAFIEAGFDVPKPYAQIDLYLVVRKMFGWPSNKLDFVAQKLLGVGKKPHEGFELWAKCIEGDQDAWTTMQAYNEQDVVITEMLYDKLKPWIPSHPNVLLYTDDPSGIACTYCGSLNYQKRGPRQLATGIYQQYRCNDCGAWFRLTKRQDGSTVR